MSAPPRTAAPAGVLRLPGGITVRHSGRAAAVAAVLLLGCAVVWTVTVFTGTYRIDAARVAEALFTGGGSD
ncbi:hypothetical protein ACIOEX_23095, partial [Streptomyces sp. NPDC087850]